MQDNMKHNNIRIIGIPEGEGIEQGIENLFKKVMMENFPNLIREKVTQIQETQSPNEEEPKEAQPTSRHIIIKVAKFQDTENLKGSKGKTGSNLEGSLDKTSSCLLNGNAPSQKGMARNILSNENRRPATKTTLPSKALNQDRRPNSFPDKRILKEYTSTTPALQEM